MIDSASEVLRIAKNYLQEASELVDGKDNYIEKIAKLNDGKRIVSILNIRSLLSFM